MRYLTGKIHDYETFYLPYELKGFAMKKAFTVICYGWGS